MSKRPTCDTIGCGRPIPVGGEGHPEICPACMNAQAAVYRETTMREIAATERAKAAVERAEAAERALLALLKAKYG